MFYIPKVLVKHVLCITIAITIVFAQYNEDGAFKLLKQLERSFTDEENKFNLAIWQYAEIASGENAILMENAANHFQEFLQDVVNKLKKFDYMNFKNDNLKRQFMLLTKMGYAVLSSEDYKELNHILTEMQQNYAKTRVCRYKKEMECNMTLMPHVKTIMASSRDPSELKHYWIEWYNRAGLKDITKYKRYIELTQKAAQLNGFKSHAEYLLSNYDDETLENQFEITFQQLFPLYQELHAYVRHRLKLKYGNLIKDYGAIPMHLLGSVFGQTWVNIIDLVIPYPDHLHDITITLNKQKYTIVKIFQIAADFVNSMNMTKLPRSFWTKSVFRNENDDNHSAICENSAYLLNNSEIRSVFCGSIDPYTFYKAFKLIGYIQVLLLYRNHPFAFRSGAFPTLDETLGDMLSLSAQSITYLMKENLIDLSKYTKEMEINMLLIRGLQDLVFLPYAYSLDKYRWEILRGNIRLSRKNCAYWKLRHELTGVEPAVVRDEHFFDASAKIHFIADMEYISKYMATINKYQFYKKACIAAKEYTRKGNFSLHNCNLYGNIDAGDYLKHIFSLGASKRWPDLLEDITGSDMLNVIAINDFFSPLIDWLHKENYKNKATPGWDRLIKCSFQLNSKQNIYNAVIVLRILLGIILFHAVRTFVI